MNRVAQGDRRPLLRPTTRLVALSFLMLFVELVLIRWTAESDVYLRFFTNFVLLASFLGIGVGFLRAGSDRRRLFAFAPGALAGLALFVLLFPVQQTRVSDVSELRGLFGTTALPAWLELSLLFVGVVVVLATIADGVARLFASFPPLQAYRLDVLGSLLGIAAFTLLSFLGARPIVWAAVATAVLLLTIEPPVRLAQLAASGTVLAVFGISSLSGHDAWSPYYKVTTIPAADGRIALRVNGLSHQSMYPLDLLEEQQPFYWFAYRHVDPARPRAVLIVGAGSGNDVAVALTQGARRVDAVEIDPVLLSRGRRQHPDDPYGDPRVRAVVDDGRAFLERTDRTYDLIVFALPDSLTLVSGQGALRLESYLFTREAMTTVRDHLRPGGVFTMYNYYRPDVFEKYASTIEQVFGRPPCYEAGPRGGSGSRLQAVLTIARDGTVRSCERLWRSDGDPPEPATDDRPFPYITGRAIPGFYLTALGLVLLGSVVIVRRTAGGLGPMRPYADLFCMGAAFLLLETKNVVQFALLFGTTWLVNSLVFAGILLSVFLAIEVARRTRLPTPVVLYGALFASLAAAWAIPGEALLALPIAARFAAATTLAFAPVFVANLVFAERFRRTASSVVAFGANLLGAMVGGVLEYAAVAIGYRALLLVVGGLYATAFTIERRREIADVGGAPSASRPAGPSPSGVRV